MEWQPIETAPRGTSQILACRVIQNWNGFPEFDWITQVWIADDGTVYSEIVYDEPLKLTPTHWLPWEVIGEPPIPPGAA